MSDTTIDNQGTCPKCGSTKIRFSREHVGTERNSYSRRGIILSNTRTGSSSSVSQKQTIGLCQNCGFTWRPNFSSSEKKSNGSCLMWFLKIMFFPITLSIWLYRTEKIKLEKKYRIIIIVLFWIFIIVIGSLNDTSTDSNSIKIENQQVNDEGKIKNKNSVKDTDLNLDKDIVEEEDTIIIYDDEKQNAKIIKLIQAYNEVADIKIDINNLVKKEYKSTPYAYIALNGIEMEINCLNGNALSVNLSVDSENAGKELDPYISDFLTVMSSLSKEQIENDIEQIRNPKGLSSITDDGFDMRLVKSLGETKQSTNYSLRITGTPQYDR